MKIEKVILVLGAGALENGYILGFKLPGAFLWPWGPKYKQFLNAIGVKFQPLNQLKCETLMTLATAAKIFHKEKDRIIFITDSFASERETAGLKQIGKMMKEFLIQRGVPPEKIIISAEASVETIGKIESFFAYLAQCSGTETFFDIFLPVPKYYKRRGKRNIVDKGIEIGIVVKITIFRVEIPFKCWFSEYFFNRLAEPWKRMKSARTTEAYAREERKARTGHKVK
jgi:hypothetical protein